MQVFASILAMIVLTLVLQDAFEVMLLPRRVERQYRFTAIYFRFVWSNWSRVAVRLPAGPRRETMLSYFGPLSMLALFAVWAATLITCFGTLEWALQPETPDHPTSVFFEQLYMSGVTFFTLGYGDIVPHSGAARLVSVLEAGTGIGFIAVVIGYLPVLYQVFARREAHVIQLDARAGSPPSAVALLCRHAEPDALPVLDHLLRDWEFWSAELIESHLSYPMLAFYRSQHDNQSWLAALCAIMDCCALILVGVQGVPPLQARMTFAIARQVVVEMSRSLHIQPSRFDGNDRLPQHAFDQMLASFAEAGIVWDPDEDGPAALAALRGHLRAPHRRPVAPPALPLAHLAPGRRRKPNHWERGHRGMLARRLVKELSLPNEERPTKPKHALAPAAQRPEIVPPSGPPSPESQVPPDSLDHSGPP